MRITTPLHRTSVKWWFKQIWKTKRFVKVSPSAVPPVVLEKGIKIENPRDVISPPVPLRETWTPPVKDDPRCPVIETVADTDHPDYNEKPIYRFEKATKLLEGQKQASVLTKTHISEGLPACVKDLCGAVSIKDQDELVQRYIMQANKWDPTKEKLPRRSNPDLPIWKFKAEYGIPKSRRNHIIVQDLLRLCYMLSHQYPEILNTRQHSRNHSLSVDYYLQDEDKHIGISGVHDVLVTTNKPLSPFASEEQVDDTVAQKLPDLFPLLPTIDLKKEHIYKLQNSNGWLREFSHTHPHTLWINDTSVWESVAQRNAVSLMFCFGHTLALAKQKYGSDVKNLREPISMQCINTDGERFDFVCFQLNTLNMQNKDGVKNLAWLDCDNKLYQRIEPKRAMLRNTKYEEYDPEVLEKILAFYANGLTIKG